MNGCTATRHGTVRAYKDGCRCPGTRDLGCRWEKAYRLRKARGQSLHTDGTGTRRRVQALVTTGWRLEDIGARLGVSLYAISELIRRDRIHVNSARNVAAIYDELVGMAGPSHKSAARALTRGWAPPEAWTADTIDDPAAQPWSWDTTGSPSVDEVAVQRALAGEHVSLPRDERGEALVRLIAAGLPPSEAGRRLRLSGASTRALLDEAS